MTASPRLRVLLVAGMLLGGLSVTSSSPSVADGEGRQPGLPYIPCTDMPNAPCPTPDTTNDYTWLGFTQIGMVGSPVAQQWSRIPLTMVASTNEIGNVFTPADENREQTNEYFYRISAIFTSPKGSKNNYGDSALVPIRTVAFGSIPAEVTLQVSQRRDSRNLPIPFIVEPRDFTEEFPSPGIAKRTQIYSTKLEDRVVVRVRKLVVDGVNVDLGSTCRTRSNATISASSTPLEVVEEEGYESYTGLGKVLDEFDPTKTQYGLYGGTFNGSIDIPGFTGCSTKTGDDLGPLLTSAVSGSGNPVRIQVGAPTCFNYTDDGRAIPNPPGVNRPTDPRAGCVENSTPNPKVLTVPTPLDFPDYAPGDAPE